MSKYFIIALLFFSLTSTILFAQNQKKVASIQHNFLKWTGDLDEMTKRRVIRVLVAYNRTNYFIDKDTQRGTAYDAMTLFEKELNQKLKLGKLGLHVVFIPVSRDELLTGLLEGRGDVAIAALTITPERLK